MRARTGVTGRVDGVGRLDVGVNLPVSVFIIIVGGSEEGFLGVRMRAPVVVVRMGAPVVVVVDGGVSE